VLVIPDILKAFEPQPSSCREMQLQVSFARSIVKDARLNNTGHHPCKFVDCRFILTTHKPAARQSYQGAAMSLHSSSGETPAARSFGQVISRQHLPEDPSRTILHLSSCPPLLPVPRVSESAIRYIPHARSRSKVLAHIRSLPAPPRSL